MGFFSSWYLNCDHYNCGEEQEGEGDDKDAREWAEANGWYMEPWITNVAGTVLLVMCAEHRVDRRSTEGG